MDPYDAQTYKAGDFARFLNDEIDMEERQYKLTEFSFGKYDAWFRLVYPDGLNLMYYIYPEWAGGIEHPIKFRIMRYDIMPDGDRRSVDGGTSVLADEAFKVLADMVHEHELAFLEGVIWAEKEAERTAAEK